MSSVITFTWTESGSMMFQQAQPVIQERPSQPPPPPPPVYSKRSLPLTLSQFYFERLHKQRKQNHSQRTIADDTDAIRHWTRHTENIDLNSLEWQTADQQLSSLRTLRSELQRMVRAMQAKQLSAVTINRVLRTLRAIFRMAADPIDFGLISKAPDLGKQFTGTNSAWQLKETRRKSRKTITADEMERLFSATESANDPHLWKSIILMLWTYGARTEDTFFNLDAGLIDFESMVMQFTANKTSKLQGVPLTPLIANCIRSLNPIPGQRIFGRIPRGCWTSTEKWKPGYYTTWSRDILPAGRFEVNRGPAEHQAACAAAADVRPNLMFHHFRKTMVTELNIYSGQAGNWVAAHYMSGVSERYYDTPTERIAKAVTDRERERLPQCFKDYFSNLSQSQEGNPDARDIENSG